MRSDFSLLKLLLLQSSNFSKRELHSSRCSSQKLKSSLILLSHTTHPATTKSLWLFIKNIYPETNRFSPSLPLPGPPVRSPSHHQISLYFCNTLLPPLLVSTLGSLQTCLPLFPILLVKMGRLELQLVLQLRGNKPEDEKTFLIAASPTTHTPC